MDETSLPQTKACGFLIVKGDPVQSFLLMKHPNRWDLPKGHVDPGESELQCALRELEEETGIGAADVRVDPAFRFTLQYVVAYEDRFGGQKCLKTVVYFLAWLEREIDIRLTEHGESHWISWNPPHDIQEQTINPLLAAVAEHLSRRSAEPA